MELPKCRTSLKGGIESQEIEDSECIGLDSEKIQCLTEREKLDIKLNSYFNVAKCIP